MSSAALSRRLFATYLETIAYASLVILFVRNLSSTGWSSRVLSGQRDSSSLDHKKLERCDTRPNSWVIFLAS